MDGVDRGTGSPSTQRPCCPQDREQTVGVGLPRSLGVGDGEAPRVNDVVIVGVRLVPCDGVHDAGVGVHEMGVGVHDALCVDAGVVVRNPDGASVEEAEVVAVPVKV